MRVLKNVAIEPTNRCDLKCRMCFSRTSGRKQGDMSIENFAKIIDELVTIPTIKSVSVNMGGEPLLHPDFEQMLELISGHGWRTGFSTNGMLLTPKICKKIVVTMVSQVDIGLDATGSKVEELRPGINYEVVKRNIRTLLTMRMATNQYYPLIGINCAFTESHLLKDILSLATEMTPLVDVIRILPTVNQNLTYQETARLLKQDTKPSEYCASPDYYMGILWNGDVIPCCVDLSAKTTMGNVFDEGVLGVFNNSKYEKLSEASHSKFYSGELSKEPEELQRCAECNIWKQHLGISLAHRLNQG